MPSCIWSVHFQKERLWAMPTRKSLIMPTSTRNFVRNAFDEFCRIRCLCAMSYFAMSFGQMSFVVVSYGQDEFCRRSLTINFIKSVNWDRVYGLIILTPKLYLLRMLYLVSLF